jgi:hypothetical protein
MSDIKCKVAREAMSEWSRRASRDIDGKTERSNGREHMSQCGVTNQFQKERYRPNEISMLNAVLSLPAVAGEDFRS